MAVKQISFTPGSPTDATRQAALALQREVRSTTFACNKISCFHLLSSTLQVRCLHCIIHPNVVRYLGVERDDVTGIISICLEYCAGGSIASLLGKFGPFNEGLVRSYVRMVLTGLAFLHQRHIMHRDVKGANVLVDADGICKLADFGASKLLQQEIMGMAHGTHSLKGTLYWMAPEVIRQTGHGRPADVWSLGCTVIEMFTAKPPWAHFSSQITALFHIASAKHPPPLPPSVSPVATSFLLRTLVREVSERADCLELLAHPFVEMDSNSKNAAAASPFSQVISASGGRGAETSSVAHAEVFESLPCCGTALKSPSSAPSGTEALLPCPSVDAVAVLRDSIRRLHDARSSLSSPLQQTQVAVSAGCTIGRGAGGERIHPHLSCSQSSRTSVGGSGNECLAPDCEIRVSTISQSTRSGTATSRGSGWAGKLTLGKAGGKDGATLSEECFSENTRFSARQLRCTGYDSMSAVSSRSAEAALTEERDRRDRATRLQEQKQRNKLLWEEELERELHYQRHQRAPI